MAVTNNCRSQPITLVELRLDQCPLHNPANGPNVSGLPTCSAVNPCPNTWANCQDKCNYECTVNSYWFTSCRMPVHLMTALDVYNYAPSSIQSIDHLPTLFCPGETISQRGVIKVCLYAPKVCNDPLSGTNLGRLIAAQKFFAGRTLRVYHGDCEMTDICQFTRTDWVIEKVDGPSGNPCVACFTAKDPLTLADKAKCPDSDDKFASNVVLGEEQPVPFTLGTALDGFPDEVGEGGEIPNPYEQVGGFILPINYSNQVSASQNLCMGRTRYVQAGNEILQVEPEINPGLIPGWNLRLKQRAVCGSELGPHDRGEKLKLCISFESEHVVDVWLRLLTECAELEDLPIDCCSDEPLSLINYESFERVRCENPLYMIDRTIICDPVSIQKLRQELAQQFLLMEAFDQTTGQIRLFSFRPPDCDEGEYEIIDSALMVKDSFTISQAIEPYNRVIISHDVVDCSDDPQGTNLGNITSYVSADLLRERCARREYKSSRDKVMASRWLNGRSGYLANTLAYRHYLLHRCPLRDITFETTNDIAKCYDFGQFVTLEHDKLRDWAGNYLQTPFMIKGKQVVDDCVRITAQESPFTDAVKPCLTCEGECPTVFSEEVDECIDDCERVW